MYSVLFPTTTTTRATTLYPLRGITVRPVLVLSVLMYTVFSWLSVALVHPCAALGELSDDAYTASALLTTFLYATADTGNTITALLLLLVLLLLLLLL